MDPKSKLIVTWHVGRRTFGDAAALCTDLSSRVCGRPLISTDAYGSYPYAIQRAFGKDADHVVLKKVIDGWYDNKSGDYHQYIKSLEKVPLNQTKADISLASTSMVERLNLTVRTFMSRANRRSPRFSKKLNNHIHAHAIFAAYYNFVRGHAGLGVNRHATPAMMAGVTNKVWSYDDLIAEIDSYWARQHQPGPVLSIVPPRQYAPLAIGQTSSLPFFVIHSQKKGEAKVHKGTCRNCQHGMGRKQGGAGRNDIYAFVSQEEAWRCAQTLAPLNPSVCSICVVGKYAGNSVRQHNSHNKLRKPS